MFPHTCARVFSRLSNLLTRVSGVEKFTLPLAAFAAVLLFVFAKIAAEMREGETRNFDQFLLLAFRSKTGLYEPLGPPWLAEVMRDITALGSFTVLGLVTFSVAGFLMLTRKRHAAGIVVLAVTSGTLVSSVLKWLFARPRPDLVPHATMVYTQSFPSGHQPGLPRCALAHGCHRRVGGWHMLGAAVVGHHPLAAKQREGGTAFSQRGNSLR